MTTKPMHLDGTTVAKAIDTAASAAQTAAETFATTAVAGVGNVSRTVTADATLALADARKTVLVNKATAVALTIPADASVAFAIGDWVQVINLGAGACTLTADAGVTLETATAGEVVDQHAVATAFKVAAETWVTFGGLAAT